MYLPISSVREFQFPHILASNCYFLFHYIHPGEGNGKPLQYSCLGNPMDRGAWHHPLMRYYKERIIRRIRLLQLRWPLREEEEGRRADGPETASTLYWARQTGAGSRAADTREPRSRDCEERWYRWPAGQRPSERGAHSPVSEASFLSTNNSS